MTRAKRCPKCGGSGPFHKNASRPDGLSGWCVFCDRAYSKRHAKTEAYRQAYQRYVASGKSAMRERRYPEKRPARTKLARAIKRGLVVRPERCSECGKLCVPHGHHHRGYSMAHALDVQWLCIQCHNKKHPAAGWSRDRENEPSLAANRTSAERTASGTLAEAPAGQVPSPGCRRV